MTPYNYCTDIGFTLWAGE